jgi:4-amino-4-deoxy-L-arabinose transferase-like glycosyltransferase
MRLSVAWLWAIVIVVRLAYALLATQIDPFLRANPLHGDATQYDATAWRLASTGEYRLDKENATAPAYLYLMAGVYLFVGHEPAAVRLLNALLGLLTLWGLWRLTHQLVGERAANLALVLATFHPHLLMITGWLYTENLVLPLIVWGIYGLLFWRGEKVGQYRESCWGCWRSRERLSFRLPCWRWDGCYGGSEHGVRLHLH